MTTQEKGFWHPDRGYWQAISPPSEKIRASYPEGTIEVPLRPGDGYEWNGTSWVLTSGIPMQGGKVDHEPI